MTRKSLRREIPAHVPSAANGPESTASVDAEVDSRRVLGDVAAFEAANGLPHDLIVAGVVAVVVATVNRIASEARRMFGARRPG